MVKKAGETWALVGDAIKNRAEWQEPVDMTLNQKVSTESIVGSRALPSVFYPDTMVGCD